MPPKKHFSSNFCPLLSAQNYVRDVESILDRVILHGHSESVILCGPSGCGKTVIVNEALSLYLADKRIAKKFRCIRVDGATQMDLGRCVDAILMQMTGTKVPRANGNLAGSVADKLKELCDALADRSGQTERGALIFIIDRIENFTDQRNQLLLYSLFDSGRDQGSPICVIGLSSVLDVLEKLEKRVKSRFSQRVIGMAGTLFADFEEFNEAVRFAMARKLSTISHEELDGIMGEIAFVNILQRLYGCQKDWLTINKFVEIVAVCANPEESKLGVAVLEQVAPFFLMDTTQRIIRDLPYLHLALLLCCFEYTKTQDEKIFNFNLIREVYLTAVKQKSRSLKFGEDFIANAFIQLEEHGLLQAATKSKNEPRHFRNLSIALSPIQLRNALKEMDLGSLPTDLRQWCEGHL